MPFSTSGLLGLLVACVAVVGVGYAGAGSAPFVADDYHLLCGLGDGSTGLDAIGMRRSTPFLRPVLGLSFAADWHVLGASAAWMHAHGFALHALCAWLLGVVAAMWTGAAAAGVVAALAFACFPVHPEAVTWISARGYPLGGCFTLAVLALALRTRRHAAASLVACALLGAAALLSVEPALPLLVYPLALLWAIGATRRGVTATVVAVAVTLAYLALRIVWLGGMGGYHSADGQSRHATLVLETTLAYLVQAWGHLIAPGPWDGGDGVVVSGGVGVAAACGLWLHAAARHDRQSIRRASALGACVVGALSVTATWATLGADLSGTRYLYFASMFWCVGLGWSAARATSDGGRRRTLAVIATVGLVAAQLTVVRAVNARWLQGGLLASAAIDGVVERVRARGTRHVFLFAPPAGFRGAHALPWGIDAALRLAVGPQLRVEVLPDAETFAGVRRVHAAATDAELRSIDVGEWDHAAAAWRWQ